VTTIKNGKIVSFSNTPQATDDAFTFTEDQLLSVANYNAVGSILTLDVTANDKGGNAKTLYSIDDGVNFLTDGCNPSIRNTARSIKAKGIHRTKSENFPMHADCKREIAFIDRGVDDLATLLEGLRPDVEPILLSNEEPATRQIARTVRGHQGLDAIHVIAHGRPGEVLFSAGLLNAQTLTNQAADLADIGAVLKDGRGLLFWSCETGQGRSGSDFLDAFARVGVRVAASAGLIGSAEKRATWQVEIRRGVEKALPPLSLDGRKAYSAIMATKTWTGGGTVQLPVTGNWNKSTNWSLAGIPGVGDDVVLAGTGNYSVTLNVNSGALNSLTVTDPTATLAIGSFTLSISGSSATAVNLAGKITIANGTINDAGGLFLASNAQLSGAGTLNISGQYTGTGILLASGGTLDVFGTVASGVGLQISSASASTLKIEGTATSAALTINSANQTLAIGQNGILTLGSLQNVTAGKIVMTSGILSDAAGLVLGAGATLSGSGGVNGPVTNSGTISVVGSTLSFSGLLTNNGQITVNSGASLLETNSAVNGGTIKLIDGSFIITLSGGLTNTGTITSSGASALRFGSGANSGSLNVTSGTLSLMDLLHNSGSTTISKGATLSASNAFINDMGGQIAINGTLTASQSVASNHGTISLAAGSLADAFGIFNWNDGTITSSGASTLAGDVSNLGTLSIKSGTLSATGALTTSGSMTISNGATLSVAGALGLGGQIAIGGTLTETGNTQINNAGTVTLSAGALKDTGGGGIANTGTITSTGASTLAGGTGGISNSGTLNVTSGTLSTSGGLFNYVSMTISNGATLNAADAFYNSSSGQITLNGTMAVTDTQLSSANYGTISLSAGALSSTLSIYNYGTLTSSGASKLGTFYNDNAGQITITGTLTVTGNQFASANHGSISLSAGTLTSLGLYNYGAVTSTGASTLSGFFENDGTLNVASGALSVTGSFALSNKAGSIVMLSNAALTDTAAGIANYGTISGSGTVTIGNAAGTHLTGAGTVMASNGTLTLVGTIDTGQTFAIATATASDLKFAGTATTAAPISITDSHQTLEIASGGSLTINAQESITNGTVVLAGGTLTDSSGINLGSGATLTGFGTVNGPITNSSALTATGGKLTVAANLTNNVPGTVSVASGATLSISGTLSNSGQIAISGTLTETGQFGNAGTIALSSGVLSTVGIGSNGAITSSGASTLAGGASGLSNSGALSVTSGTLSMTGALSNSGSTLISTGATLATTGALTNFGGQILIQGLLRDTSSSALNNISAGTIALSNGGALTDTTAGIANNGTISGSGTVTIGNAAGTHLTGAGTVMASNGTLTLVGTIDTGQTFAIATATASDLKFAGTATTAAPISITDSHQTLEIASGGSLTINAQESITNGTVVLAGGTLTDSSGINLGSGATLTGFGTVNGPITNSSALTATGGKLTVAANLTNNVPGTVSVASGATLSISGTLSNSGQIAIAGTLTETGNAQISSAGSITLSAGTLKDTGSGGLNNLGAITSSGASTLAGGSGGIGNSGTLTVADGTLAVTGALTNNGAMTIVTGATFNTSSLFTNTSGHSINVNGTLNVATGASALNNAGTIALSGGSLTDTTAGIANAGTISGYGIITVGSAAGTHLKGSGTILAIGGQLTLAGTIDSGQTFMVVSATQSDLRFVGTATSASAIAINNVNQTLTVDVGGSLTINALESITNGSIAMRGGTLTDSAGVTIGNAATLNGFGAVAAPLSGTGAIITSGGVLEVKSGITGALALTIGSGAADKLLLDATSNVSSLAFSGVAGTLEVNTSSTLTVSSSLAVGANTVKLDGTGSILTDANGLTLAGGVISGSGGLASNTNLAGYGIVSIAYNSADTVTATGGTLEFTKAVDSTGTTTFHIADVAGSILKFDGAVGTNAIAPTIVFDGGNGVLDLTSLSGGLANFHATVSGFDDGESIRVNGAASASLNGSILTVFDGSHNALGTIALSGNYSGDTFNVINGVIGVNDLVATITNNVANVGVPIGVSVSDDGSPVSSNLTYQWQVSHDGGLTWANAAGAGATTNAYTPAQADLSGELHVLVTYSETYGTESTTSNVTSAVLGEALAIPSFSETTFAAGLFPYSVATGDLNGDGRIDIAVVNRDSNDISVLLSKGGGTFYAQTSYAIGSTPLSVAIGDVNGDGKPDLAATNALDNSVSILLGKGDGTFQTQTPYPAGFNPVTVAIGNIAGDNVADLVVTNYQNVTVLPGDGLGGFPNGTPYLNGFFAVAILQDLNGDNIPDIAVTSSSDNTVSILLGNSDGTFAYQSHYATNQQPQALTTGDLNGDGRPDLVVGNAADSSISVFLNAGNGTFAEQTTYAITSPALGVVVGDLNGDGQLDIATANPASNTISILLGYGNGIFQNEIAVAAGSNPDAIAIADLNGDAAPDLILSNSGNNTVSVLLSEHSAGQLSFAAPIDISGPAGGIVTGDFNSDGKVDFVIEKDHALSVYFGNGDGTFQNPSSYSSGADPAGYPNLGLATADFNGDGKLDLVTTEGPNSGSKLAVLLNNGDGTFGTPSIYNTGTLSTAVAAADVNNDGKTDLVVGDYGGNTISVLLGNGDGTFGTASQFSTAGGGANPFHLAVADLNNDGKMDVVTTNNSTNTVSVLMGNGDGTFGSPTAFFAGTNPVWIEIHDLNHDGKQDLVVEDQNGVYTAVLLGNGNGTFQGAQLYAPGAFGGTVADLNGDGNLDIVAGGNGAGMNVLLGNGDGTFKSSVNFAANNGARVASADVNGDGHADLIGISGNGISILLNTSFG
jgi:large repetitive protein